MNDNPEKAVMLSLRPEWAQKIFSGEKTREVRKRAPLLKHPYKVYVYCTKGGDPVRSQPKDSHTKPYEMNGTVCGECTCVSTVDYTPPWTNHLLGTCLTAEALKDYAGNAGYLSYMAVENVVVYDKPRKLEDFGIDRAPQSWCYVRREHG